MEEITVTPTMMRAFYAAFWIIVAVICVAGTRKNNR